MQVRALDHLVLTVADPEATADFYVRVLGMRRVVFGEGRLALAFGDPKINLHRAGSEFELKALRPTPGSADLCFLLAGAIDGVAGELDALGVTVEDGPVERTGATGPLLSIYFRDPDGNLVEVSEQRSPHQRDQQATSGRRRIVRTLWP